MNKDVESLNISNSAAIVFHKIFNSRKKIMQHKTIVSAKFNNIILFISIILFIFLFF